MQSAQSWRGRRGEASHSSLSTSVFTRMHAVCDNMCLNLSVLESICLCVCSSSLHVPECKCDCVPIWCCCLRLFLMFTLIHVVCSELHFMQM